MVRGQHPLDDRDPDFLADLSRDLANPFANRAREHLFTVLGDPNEVITVMINRVLPFVMNVFSALKLSV